MLRERARLHAPLKDLATVSAKIAKVLCLCCAHQARRNLMTRGKADTTLVGSVTYFAGPNLIDMRSNIFLLMLGLASIVATSPSPGKLQSPQRADVAVPTASSFPTCRLVSLGGRRVSTGKGTKPTDSVGCRGRVVSVV